MRGRVSREKVEWGGERHSPCCVAHVINTQGQDAFAPVFVLTHIGHNMHKQLVSIDAPGWYFFAGPCAGGSALSLCCVAHLRYNQNCQPMLEDTGTITQCAGSKSDSLTLLLEPAYAEVAMQLGRCGLTPPIAKT